MRKLSRFFGKRPLPYCSNYGFGAWWAWWLYVSWSACYPSPASLPHALILLGQCLLPGSLGLAALAIALFRQHLIPFGRKRSVCAIACAASLIGTALTTFAASGHIASYWLLVGSTLMGSGSAPLILSWGELLSVMDTRRTAICISGSLLVGSALCTALLVLSHLLPQFTLVSLPCLLVVSFITLHNSLQSDFDSSPEKPSLHSRIEIHTPRNAGLSLLVYGFAFGLILTFTASSIVPGEATPTLAYAIGIGVAAMLFLAAALRHSGPNVDLTHRAWPPLAVTILLFLPTIGVHIPQLSGALVVIGYVYFSMLTAVTSVRIARQLASPPTVVNAWAVATFYLGISAGTFAEFVLARQIAQIPASMSAISLVLVLLAVWLNAFPFSEHNFCTLWGLSPNVAENIDTIGYGCRRIADSYGLTPREHQVLVLLAKGRNAEYLQKELVISIATAKTHIHRVYMKLGVHTRQQLIDLVEVANAPSTPSDMSSMGETDTFIDRRRPERLRSIEKLPASSE